MDEYSIILKPSVEKDFRKLSDSMTERIFDCIEQLKTEPFPRQAVKITGKEPFYRIRIGDYRIIYSVDTQIKQIVIHYIRHRSYVYRSV